MKLWMKLWRLNSERFRVPETQVNFEFHCVTQWEFDYNLEAAVG